MKPWLKLTAVASVVVVPVMHCYMDDLSQWLQRLWAGKKTPPGRIVR